MSGPHRELGTKWGVLYALSDDGETVRFTTVDPSGERQENRLAVHGVRYSFQVALRRGETPALGRDSYWQLDDTWYVSADEAMHSLRRPDGSEFTANAWMRVRHELLPGLARWLHGDDGQSLLEDGRAARQDECKELAGDAVVALRIALGTARSVLRSLSEGEPIRPADEQFLQDVVPQVDTWMDRAGRAPAPENPFRYPPATNPPEVPGL